MDPIYAKAIVILSIIVAKAIRTRPEARSRKIPVAKNRSGALDVAFFVVVSLSTLPLLIWLFSPVLSFADYPLHPIAYVAGILCVACGFWLLHRSHEDLGSNFAQTLKIRENHQLITEGVYRHIRHPMYASGLLLSLGMGLVVPNSIAGPAFFLVFLLAMPARLVPEERMMTETFGAEYQAYCKRTERLVPGLF